MENLKYAIYRLKWAVAKRIVPRYPLNCDFELSSVCNLRCSFCPHSLNEKDFNQQVMPFEDFKRCIDEISGKVPCIKFNLRGESTLHPDFMQFLDYTKGKFIDSRINTNGQYKDNLINYCMVDNLKEICFSVDAYHPETYRKIRGGDLNVVEMNIEECLKMIAYTNSKAKVVLSFTICEENAGEAEIFKASWKMHYPEIEFRFRKVWDRTTDARNSHCELKRKNCFMPNRRLVVASNGDVYPCCVQWHKPFIVLGNIGSAKLLDIWNCFRIKHLRRALSRKHIMIGELPPACHNCDSREAYDVK